MKIIEQGIFTNKLTNSELESVNGGTNGTNTNLVYACLQICGGNACGVDSCGINVCAGNACGTNFITICIGLLSPVL